MSYQNAFNHLDKISSSFSHCIAILASPHREWLTLAYLMCRMIDTIEDADWASQETQNALFEAFKNRLTHEHLELNEWDRDLPHNINLNEKALISDIDYLFKLFYALPSDIKSIFQDTLLHMLTGMQYFSIHYKTHNRFEITTIPELNQYCFYAAGVVGELLTKLYSHHSDTLILSDDLMLNAFHYGFFLQKINILKDIRVDRDDNKIYFSSLTDVKLSLHENARGALLYLKSLPQKTHAEFRLSCAWIIFTNLTSLSWINQSIENGIDQKMPAKVATDIMQKVKTIVHDDDELEALFNRFSLDWPAAVVRHDEQFKNDWYTQLYKGHLSKTKMVDLGMFSQCAQKASLEASAQSFA